MHFSIDFILAFFALFKFFHIMIIKVCSVSLRCVVNECCVHFVFCRVCTMELIISLQRQAI